MFEMFLNKITYHESIIHIGLGGNAGTYGDRNPALLTNKVGLHTASSINGNNNFWRNNPVVLNKWIRVVVSQTLRDGKVSLMKDHSKTEK